MGDRSDELGIANRGERDSSSSPKPSTSYDATLDPRTGRPPTALEAERLKQERIAKSEQQESRATDHSGQGANAGEVVVTEEPVARMAPPPAEFDQDADEKSEKQEQVGA